MQKLISLLVTICFLSTNQNIMADNLIGAHGSNTIKVSKVNGAYLFQYCAKKENGNMSCENISDKTFTQSELNEIAKKELDEAWLKSIGVTAGAAAVLIGLFHVNVMVLAGAALASADLPLLFTLGSFVTGSTLVSLPFWKKMKKINPFRQFKQARVLTKRNFIDHDITIDDEDVAKAAQLLKEILK
jgi:hypothetical protein